MEHLPPTSPGAPLLPQIARPADLSALVEQIYRRGKATYGELSGEMVPVRLYEALAGIELRLPGRAQP